MQLCWPGGSCSHPGKIQSPRTCCPPGSTAPSFVAALSQSCLRLRHRLLLSRQHLASCLLSLRTRQSRAVLDTHTHRPPDLLVHDDAALGLEFSQGLFCVLSCLDTHIVWQSCFHSLFMLKQDTFAQGHVASQWLAQHRLWPRKPPSSAGQTEEAIQFIYSFNMLIQRLLCSRQCPRLWGLQQGLKWIKILNETVAIKSSSI